MKLIKINKYLIIGFFGILTLPVLAVIITFSSSEIFVETSDSFLEEIYYNVLIGLGLFLLATVFFFFRLS
jgi:hypothetical protein